MPSCAVSCCKKKSETSSIQKDNVSFHKFPKDPILWDIWKKFCNKERTWCPTRNSTICSVHFKTSDFQVLKNNRRILVEGTKPTLIPHCICSSHPLSYNDNSAGASSIPCSSVPLPCMPSFPQIHSHPLSYNDNSAGASSIPCSSPLPSMPYIPQIHIQLNNISGSHDTNSSLVIPLKQRKMQERLDFQRVKIKRLQSNILFLKKKVAGLQEIHQTVNKRSLIDNAQSMVLGKVGVEERELIIRQLQKSKSGKLSRTKYSQELKRFAVTLNLISPKAYQYVRKIFGTCLPAPRTLAKWHTDGHTDDGHTDGHTNDGHTDGHTNDGHTDGHTDGHSDGHSDGHTDTGTDSDGTDDVLSDQNISAPAWNAAYEMEERGSSSLE